MERQSSRVWTVLAVLTAVLLAGCTGLTQPPLAPVASDSAPHATKKAKGNTTSVSKLVGDQGGTLKAKLHKTGGKNDVMAKDVSFRIELGSIVGGGEHEITMEVHSGTTVDDIRVVFSPSGLAFSPMASLTMRLRGPVTAEQVSSAQHICGGGKIIESITTETDRKGNSFLVVELKVPGFSIYSLGGDDMRADQMGQNIMMMW